MNIFENAKFGDRFRTRDGQMAIYMSKMPDGEFHKLLCSDLNCEHYHSNGRYAERLELRCDIVSRWQEPIDDEEYRVKREELIDKAIDWLVANGFFWRKDGYDATEFRKELEQ